MKVMAMQLFRTSPVTSRYKHGAWLFMVVLATLVSFAGMNRAMAATITLEEAKACYDQLNGKSSATTTPTNAACSQVCVADGPTVTDPKWNCINPKAVALTSDQLSNTVLDAKRLYGSAVGSAICDQEVEQERASCVEYAKTVVIDCINAWVATLTTDQLKDFLITNINVDTVAGCAAAKLNAPKATVASALNNSKAEVDEIVNGAVEEVESGSREDACTTDGGTWNDTTNTCNTNGAVCSGGALGWLLCPLMDMMSNVITGLADSIGDFMQFQPLTGSDSGKAIQAVWQITVVPANLILVIAFLVVIFSQATSIGLSAYGIKKMLPRVIAAAILINLSFFICTILIDIFNILGASVAGIFQNASSALPAQGGSVASYNGLEYSAAIAVLLHLLAAGTTVAVLVGGIGFILPVALSAAISLLVVFGVLAIRHIVAILLIIIAPLAFAAMVLPNTEGLFRKWGKMLIITLALYPVIMALAHGSLLASKIILLTGPSGNDLDGVYSWTGIVTTAMAFIVLFAWIWALKFVMSWGGGVIGKVAGMANDRGKGLIDRSKNWAKEKKDRSTYQQLKNMKRNAGNTAAQRRAIQRFDSKGLGGFVARRGAYGMFGTKNSRFGYQREGNVLLGTQADKAITGIQREQREAMMEHVNRPTMDLVGRGFQLGDDNKSFVRGNQRFSLDQIADDKAMQALGFEKAFVAKDALDAATLSHMAYMRDNNVLGTTNGVKMATEMAYKTGAMDTTMLKELNSRVSMEDKGEYIEYSNAQAHANGYGHLGFTSTDDTGNIITGGRLGGMNVVAEKTLKSFGSVSKDMYADTSNKEWVEAAYDYIDNIKRKTPDTYMSELAKMDDQQAVKFLKLMNTRAKTRPGASESAEWMSATDFGNERAEARKNFSKS